MQTTKNQTERIAFRCTPVDKAIFHELAKHFGKSESETIRLVARELFQALKSEQANQPTQQQQATQ